MARAFKDMIVQEADGKPRLTFRNRQGAAVLEDVAVEVSSSVQQQGDAWGALAANLLLELDDDDVSHAVALNLRLRSCPAALISREKLATAFGKLAAAVVFGVDLQRGGCVITQIQPPRRWALIPNPRPTQTEREGQYQRDIFGADRREQSEDLVVRPSA